MNSSTIQAVLLRIDGVGVLIRGPSGSGKSIAALRLLDRGHRLVSDDLVEVVLDHNGRLMGLAVEKDARIELRGLGVFPAKSLYNNGVVGSSSIDLVVELDAYDASRDAGRMFPEVSVTYLLGGAVETVRVPLPIGADSALLIELLAKRFKEFGSVGG
jgi:HPr kinase/phosphorylase